MRNRLDGIEHKLEDLERELMEPEVASDSGRYSSLMKERSSIIEIAELYVRYKDTENSAAEARDILENESDREMKELAREELSSAAEEIGEMENQLKILMLPGDPNDERNVVMEIRAGTGGEEAALFASDLYRMYSRYIERRGWSSELTELEETGVGGIKNVSFLIRGRGAYSVLKYESGVHRVQRVPETESQGRIHTSAATVAVMPEAEPVDVTIDEKDIRIDVMRASGNGGQCVNTTDSAVRLTHYPTGIVIYSQTEKSQIQNKEKAFALLRTKLYALETQLARDRESADRKKQVGSGDRSEKIRTYNFPQGRVTDHRIHLTVYRIDDIMNGELDMLIDPVIAEDRTRRLLEFDNENQ
ncbi:MAG: peptide chain release factor 1 [Lachnospiraceae bacterium]|nr:peptide chain release factor 1 [Lachnospiraceae bacterium]